MCKKASLVWVLVTLLLPTLYCSASDEPAPWLTGRDLERKAQLALSGQWTDAPLGPLLNRLARQQNICVFVDRRVDPRTSVTLRARNRTWEQLLHALGAPHGYAVCRLDNVYYFGPESVCAALPTHYAALRRELNDNRQLHEVRWRTTVDTHWERLSQPGQLLQQMADDHSVELLQDPALPLDIWPEFDGPPIPMVLKALLLVAGFDRWLAISRSGKRMKIVTFPAAKSGTYTIYDVPKARNVVRAVKPKSTSIKVRASGKTTVTVTGAFDQIMPVIRKVVEGQDAIKNDQEEGRFTAELKGKRGTILATVANQLSIELKFDPRFNPILGEHVEFNVVDATAEDIIQRALEGTNLRYQIHDRELKVMR